MKKKHSLLVWDRIKYLIRQPVTPGSARHYLTRCVTAVDFPQDLATFGQEGYKITGLSPWANIPDPVVRPISEYPPELFTLAERIHTTGDLGGAATPDLVDPLQAPTFAAHRKDLTDLDKGRIRAMYFKQRKWSLRYMEGEWAGECQDVIPRSGVQFYKYGYLVGKDNMFTTHLGRQRGLPGWENRLHKPHELKNFNG